MIKVIYEHHHVASAHSDTSHIVQDVVIATTSPYSLLLTPLMSISFVVLALEVHPLFLLSSWFTTMTD